MIGFALSLPIMKPLMKPITTPDKIPISIATGKPKLIVCTVIIPPTAMVSGMDISVMLPEYVMKISPALTIPISATASRMDWILLAAKNVPFDTIIPIIINATTTT